LICDQVFFLCHLCHPTWIVICVERSRITVKHFLLFYDAADDYAARRPDFRDAHLEKAWASHARGELMLGGALSDPVDGAVLLFKGDSSRVAEDFAKTDPYVVNGLVRRWKVREWLTVAGDQAANPVRPKS
jgi:uncharacterized protein YciI